jgi:hypothetical protein
MAEEREAQQTVRMADGQVARIAAVLGALVARYRRSRHLEQHEERGDAEDSTR